MVAISIRNIKCINRTFTDMLKTSSYHQTNLANCCKKPTAEGHIVNLARLCFTKNKDFDKKTRRKIINASKNFTQVLVDSFALKNDRDEKHPCD